jgi:hypothetical protein
LPERHATQRGRFDLRQRPGTVIDHPCPISGGKACVVVSAERLDRIARVRVDDPR